MLLIMVLMNLLHLQDVNEDCLQSWDLRAVLKFVLLLQVAPILVPLLKFYFHEEVRKAAVSGECIL